MKLLALMLIPQLLVAQVRGVVRDEQGQPVSEVMVELLSAGARLAVTQTDSAGSFAFIATPTPALALVARRIGYLPTRMQLAGMSSPVAVVLRRRLVEVAGVTVEARGGRCIDRDEPAARALWEQSANRYANGSIMHALWADRMGGAGVVPPESLGSIDTTRAQRSSISGIGRRPLPSNREQFYAQPPLLGTQRSYQWDYPLFESVQAWHFADELFGALNRLAMAPPEVGERVIEFCSRAQRGNRPYIAGRLYLAPDLTFLKAEWRFTTQPPEERAGGEVVFMPPSPNAPLLAQSGHFWRRYSSGYFQEWSEFLQWYECEGLTRGCDIRRPLRN